MTIFSIGHSTHEPDAFLDLMRGVSVLVDIRSHPTSKWEWWRRPEMGWIAEGGIELIWEPALGGWTQRHYEQYHESMIQVGVDLGAYSKGVFPKQRIGAKLADPDDGRPHWTNRGLMDYSWYMTTDDFHHGLTWLHDTYGASDAPNAAIMCAEALWWKCHRSLVADALWFRFGCDTLHLKPTAPKNAATSRFTRHSDTIGNRIERYEPAVLDSLRSVAAH